MSHPTPQSTQTSCRPKSLSLAATISTAAALGLASSVHAQGSEQIKIALVGCGGRGTGAAINALENTATKNVKLIALADAFQRNLDNSLQAIQSQCADRVDVPDERRFAGLDAYQKAIDCRPDVVLLCSPPGFRPAHFEAAVKAGVHVFMEKPVAVDGPGVRRVLAANEEAKRKKLAVAVGHHLRHEQKHREVVRRIHDGAIGHVQFQRVYFNSSGVWVRPRRPEQTEMQYQVNNWYYFTWLSGDHIVEQHVHDIDVGNWIKNAYPVKANGMGGRQVRIGPDYGEIFDHHSVEFEYADGSRMYSVCRHMPGCWDSFSEHAHGTKGFASIQGHGTSELMIAGQEPMKWKRTADGHQVEMDDLFKALLAGDPYNEGDFGAFSTLTAILGRMASYSGQEVTWEQAMQSTLELGPKEYRWDAEAPANPGENGIYPCATPGVTRAF